MPAAEMLPPNGIQTAGNRDAEPIIMSLAEFTTTASQLLRGSDQAQDLPEFWESRVYHPFTRFVLAGILEQDGQERRVDVNPLLDSFDVVADGYRLQRDFDSVIGVTRDLPFKGGAFTIKLVPDVRRSMNNENWNKLFHKMIVSGVRISQAVPEVFQPLQNAHDRLGDTQTEQSIPLWRIPNYLFGNPPTPHSRTFLFLPSEYDGAVEGCAPIADATIEKIYGCVRFAVKKTFGNKIAYYPPYAAVVANAKTKNEKLTHFPEQFVPEDGLEAFHSELMRSLARAGFDNAFFVHEVQGIKVATSHSLGPIAPFDLLNTLRLKLPFLNHDQLKPREWYVDVAVEVRGQACGPDDDTPYVLLWRATSLPALIKHILPRATYRQRDNVVKRAKRDVVAHLYQCQGFRAEARSDGKPDGVIYINIYTTDKTPTYRIDNRDGHFRRHTPNELLPVEIAATLRSIDNYSDTFSTCFGNNTDGDAQIGCLRLETRVPMEKASEALSGGIPPELIASSSLCLRADTWWCARNSQSPHPLSLYV